MGVMNAGACVLFIVITSCNFQLGSSYSCYACNSIEVEGCADDEFTRDEVGVLEECYSCAKIKAESGLVMRFCVVVGYSDDTCMEDKTGKVCYCQGNFCNSGEHIAVSMTVLLFSMAMLFL